MSNTSRTLAITAIVIIAIVLFIFYQNKTASKSNENITSNAQSSEAVVIAYQTGDDPTKVAQADGEYEKNSGQSIEWKKFDTGADVVNALASGDVDIGNIGTSPLAAAASRNLPIEVFFITAKLGSSEALVVSQKSGIAVPQDLKGKTIAVPFVSTAHYSLLSALKHWNISENEVKVINLRPPEISAAWERGDIDATYVWEPALSKASATGKILTDSKQVSEWGAPTFDVWVVRKDFAAKNPEFLKSFTQTSLAKIDQYNQDPKAFETNSDYLNKIATLTGSSSQDIPLLLSGNVYLNQQQQIESLDQEFPNVILNTATFLKSQGKVDQVKADYKENATSAFLK